MKDKYLHHTLEELLEDHDFINRVISRTNKEEWVQFSYQHPECRNTIEQAKKMILLLRDVREEDPDEREKLDMWQRIKGFESAQKKKTLFILFRSVLRYAAVFMLFLLSGTAIYLYYTRPGKSYQFTTGETVSTGGEARLVLSSGEEVKLEKDNSSIKISKDQKIIINDERTIDVASQTVVTETIKMNEVIIPYGKKSQLVLDDGTKVWLNAGSRLAFPGRFTGKKREVFLQGEAYFEVAHLADKPFFVNTDEVSVKVLGTRFNLSAYPNDKEIITVLLEGSIAMNDNVSRSIIKKETLLEPGQVVNLTRDTRAVQINREEDVDVYIAWTEGWFTFYQESLVSVFRKLERYYNIEVEFNSPYHANDLITGKLDLKDSLEGVMIAMADVANIEFQINNTKVTISKKRQ